ncbi:MAG: ATP-dependent DNA helicase [Deltaproteobacteria bacterium]|nr:ATP-dependent DNA helicase [Deltaproteobacteria bacterium]
MDSDLARKVRAAFSPGGAVAAALPGFEPRPGQERLAAAFAGTLSCGGILVAEAATGIGKTLAYLVPLILSGHKAVVSTGTRTLQQQLLENDIPLARRACRIPFACAVLKGRANYLCRRRWKEFAAEPAFEFAREAALFERMREFAETTRTGDLSECRGIPDDFRAWSEVNARSEACDAATCAEVERCFLMEARRRAAEADLVVVNHHLFFAALALRAKGEPSGPGGEDRRAARGDVLPDTGVVVFDEAHGIEEVASSFFGAHVSLGRAHEMGRDLRRACGRGGDPWRPVLPAAEAFRREADLLFGSLGDGEGRFFLPRGGADPSFDRRYGALLGAAEALSLALANIPPAKNRAGDAASDPDSFLRRVRSFCGDLTALVTVDPSEAVAWGERRGPSVTLWGTPIEVGPILARWLWTEAGAVLLTSATLSVSGNLSYFRERLGLDAVDARELIVDNEFDYGSRALLYIPRGLPDPGDDGFPAAAAREAMALLEMSGGGALVLCTSFRTLAVFEETIRGALPFALFVQGEGPRMQLLRAFREDGDAVLIGTGTFWEGVDVPGGSLRMVVIDKLPFAPPADPVVSARIRAIRDRGEDPFVSFQLPEAVLALRQGVGRLLRRGDDYGVVALLDRRVAEKSYGPAFRGSLPRMPWTRDRARVEEFFRRFRPAEANHSGGEER